MVRFIALSALLMAALAVGAEAQERKQSFIERLVENARLVKMEGRTGETVYAGPASVLLDPFTKKVRKNIRIPESGILVPVIYQNDAAGKRVYSMFLLAFDGKPCGTTDLRRTGSDPFVVVIPDNFKNVDPAKVKVEESTHGKRTGYDSKILIAFTEKDSAALIPGTSSAGSGSSFSTKGPAGPMGETKIATSFQLVALDCQPNPLREGQPGQLVARTTGTPDPNLQVTYTIVATNGVFPNGTSTLSATVAATQIVANPELTSVTAVKPGVPITTNLTVTYQTKTNGVAARPDPKAWTDPNTPQRAVVDGQPNVQAVAQTPRGAVPLQTQTAPVDAARTAVTYTGSGSGSGKSLPTLQVMAGSMAIQTIVTIITQPKGKTEEKPKAASTVETAVVGDSFASSIDNEGSPDSFNSVISTTGGDLTLISYPQDTPKQGEPDARSQGKRDQFVAPVACSWEETDVNDHSDEKNVHNGTWMRWDTYVIVFIYTPAIWGVVFASGASLSSASAAETPWAERTLENFRVRKCSKPRPVWNSDISVKLMISTRTETTLALFGDKLDAKAQAFMDLEGNISGNAKTKLSYKGSKKVADVDLEGTLAAGVAASAAKKLKTKSSDKEAELKAEASAKIKNAEIIVGEGKEADITSWNKSGSGPGHANKERLATYGRIEASMDATVARDLTAEALVETRAVHRQYVGCLSCGTYSVMHYRAGFLTHEDDAAKKAARNKKWLEDCVADKDAFTKSCTKGKNHEDMKDAWKKKHPEDKDFDK